MSFSSFRKKVSTEKQVLDNILRSSPGQVLYIRDEERENIVYFIVIDALLYKQLHDGEAVTVTLGPRR